jgi:hypothetical protein
MEVAMRALGSVALLIVFGMTAVTLCASPPDSASSDQQNITALEAKASQAQPREQCFLYAQLVQQMTELSIRQYEAGDVAKATSLLHEIQHIAQKIHLSVVEKDKRLKKAEILLDNTAFRLHEMLQASSFEDRPLVKQTLDQVTQAQNATMLQVFQK